MVGQLVHEVLQGILSQIHPAQGVRPAHIAHAPGGIHDERDIVVCSGLEHDLSTPRITRQRVAGPVTRYLAGPGTKSVRQSGSMDVIAFRADDDHRFRLDHGGVDGHIQTA